jgi:hypothetical protein
MLLLLSFFLYFLLQPILKVGSDAANEVITEARLLLVENYFQTPSGPKLVLGLWEFLEELTFWVKPYKQIY